MHIDNEESSNTERWWQTWPIRSPLLKFDLRLHMTRFEVGFKSDGLDRPPWTNKPCSGHSVDEKYPVGHLIAILNSRQVSHSSVWVESRNQRIGIRKSLLLAWVYIGTLVISSVLPKELALWKFNIPISELFCRRTALGNFYTSLFNQMQYLHLAHAWTGKSLKSKAKFEITLSSVLIFHASNNHFNNSYRI